MLTVMEVQLVIVTAMVLAVIAIAIYTYDRDQAAQRKQLVRIPVKVRPDRRQMPLPEEETRETSPAVYYIGILLVAYLIAVLLLAA